MDSRGTVGAVNAHERAELARQILDNPLFGAVLSELEQAAIETAINAPILADNIRAAAMAETRAIRAFRSKLRASLEDMTPRKGAPA